MVRLIPFTVNSCAGMDKNRSGDFLPGSIWAFGGIQATTVGWIGTSFTTGTRELGQVFHFYFEKVR